MSNIHVGDTVVFRDDAGRKCSSSGVADFRGVVTEISNGWLFMTEASGRSRVMPVTSMRKVARNGLILESV
jgi:hypothetical protein